VAKNPWVHTKTKQLLSLRHRLILFVASIYIGTKICLDTSILATSNMDQRKYKGSCTQIHIGNKLTHVCGGWSLYAYACARVCVRENEVPIREAPSRVK
jgi:hypothetical protein